MVALPVVTGLFGIEAGDGGQRLTIAPQLPAGWDRAAVRNLAVGSGRYDVTLQRAPDQFTLRIEPVGKTPSTRALALSPAVPLDARVTGVTVNGQPVAWESGAQGDVQRAHVTLPAAAGAQAIVVSHTPGTEVVVEPEPLRQGATSQGLRVLRVRPGPTRCGSKLEGRAGRTYELRVRTPRQVGSAAGVVSEAEKGGAVLKVTFEGTTDGYVQRELTLPLLLP